MLDSELVFMFLFCLALFFQVLYFRFRGELLGMLCALIAAMVWITAAPVWMFAEQTNFTSLSVLFWGLGVINVIFAMEGGFRALHDSATRSRRRSDADEYE